MTLLAAPAPARKDAAASSAVAAVAEPSGPIAPTELVVVRLGGCRYALPMSAVAEVGRPPSLTRVPGLAERRDRLLLVRCTTGNLRHDGPVVAAQLAAVLT